MEGLAFDMTDSVTLVNADCREYLNDLEDNSVHLVITDPPYFLDKFESDWDSTKVQASRKKAGVVGGLPVGMKFDPQQGRHLQVFMNDVAGMTARILCPGGFFLAFSSPRLVHRMAVGIEDAGYHIRDMYAWRYTRKAQQKAFGIQHLVDKTDLPEADRERVKQHTKHLKTPQLRPEFECIIVAQNPLEDGHVKNWMRWETGLIDVWPFGGGENNPTTVFTVEKEPKDPDNPHPTVKPVELMERLIRIFTGPRQWVLDPFMGSGTTLVAALRQRRHGIGIEVEPEYYEIARRRMHAART